MPRKNERKKNWTWRKRREVSATGRPVVGGGAGMAYGVWSMGAGWRVGGEYARAGGVFRPAGSDRNGFGGRFIAVDGSWVRRHVVGSVLHDEGGLGRPAGLRRGHRRHIVQP